MRARGVIGATVAGLVLLVGFGTQADVRNPELDARPDLSLLPKASIDFDATNSPEELIDERDPAAIIVGVVERIEKAATSTRSPETLSHNRTW